MLMAEKEGFHYKVGQIRLAPVELIEVDPSTRIRILSGKDLTKLYNSIQKYGQFHPIVVDQHLKLVFGFSRYEVIANLLHHPQILIYIKQFDSELERLDAQVSENIHRTDFTDYELGMAIWKRLLLETFHSAGILGDHEKDGSDTVSDHRLLTIDPQKISSKVVRKRLQALIGHHLKSKSPEGFTASPKNHC